MSVPYDAATAPGLGRLVLLTLGTAIGAHVLSLVAATVGAVQGSVPLAILLRGTAALLVVALVASSHAGRWRPANVKPYVAVALGSYLLNPLSWEGKALFGQLTGNLVVAIVLDAILWAGAFLAALLLRARLTRPSATA